jgi:hypothetical protein
VAREPAEQPLAPGRGRYTISVGCRRASRPRRVKRRVGAILAMHLKMALAILILVLICSASSARACSIWEMGIAPRHVLRTEGPFVRAAGWQVSAAGYRPALAGIDVGGAIRAGRGPFMFMGRAPSHPPMDRTGSSPRYLGYGGPPHTSVEIAGMLRVRSGLPVGFYAAIRAGALFVQRGEVYERVAWSGDSLSEQRSRIPSASGVLRDALVGVSLGLTCPAVGTYRPAIVLDLAAPVHHSWTWISVGALLQRR